jgi:hypothetical protein
MNPFRAHQLPRQSASDHLQRHPLALGLFATFPEFLSRTKRMSSYAKVLGSIVVDKDCR